MHIIRVCSVFMQIFTAQRLANCPGRDQEAFPPICEIGSGSKILFVNGSPGQNIWVHKILSCYAENSASEVDPRFEKKTGNSYYLNLPISQSPYGRLVLINLYDSQLVCMILQKYRKKVSEHLPATFFSLRFNHQSQRGCQSFLRYQNVFCCLGSFQTSMALRFFNPRWDFCFHSYV